MKPETAFRNNKVRPFLKTLKNSFWFPISQRSISGTPDFIGCANGRFVALELKSESGVASALQARNLMRVSEVKGVSIIASPKNWNQVKQILMLLDHGKKIPDFSVMTPEQLVTL